MSVNRRYGTVTPASDEAPGLAGAGGFQGIEQGDSSDCAEALRRVKAPAVLAWHYSTGEKFMSIMTSGLLLPATVGVIPPECPVVWFSLVQDFEPTALKGIVAPDGSRRMATLKEMRELAGGLVRFGIAPRALLTGEALRRKARINRATWAGLCAAGRKAGADPGMWFGVCEPLDVDELVLEVENAARWVPAQGGAA